MRAKIVKVLITGSNGFIGKNLQVHLAERKNVEIVYFTRSNGIEELPDLMQGIDFVFHLAGVNRSLDPKEFFAGNVKLTSALCHAVFMVAQSTGKKVSIIYASSTQAGRNSHYGQSKLAAEVVLQTAALDYGIPVYIFRLPNVFGKWCKPNYNSVVATFCYNIARDLTIQVNDPDAQVILVYVDDLIQRFMQLMDGVDALTITGGFAMVAPQYITTVGDLARQIQAFKDSRKTLMIESVGRGKLRALYATYLSYLPVESFSYALPRHTDPRGVFGEMLKTPDYGQISFFTAHPGCTRGGHYHHSKTEKFLVIQGHARFKFRHIQTGQVHELVVTGDKSEVVETVPGWTHDITNIGPYELTVLLWANEIFEPERPDTIAG